MTNAELIAALRECANWIEAVAASSQYAHDELMALHYCDKLRDAADALEAAERLLDLNTKRCEALRQQLREAHESYEKHLNELEAQMPKWTMLKDEIPKPHTNVLVSGIEAINNTRVYKVMVNDNGTLRPTDYAPSIMWDYWMPFDCPNCGARMDG